MKLPAILLSQQAGQGVLASDLGTWHGSPADGLLPGVDQPVQGALMQRLQARSTCQQARCAVSWWQKLGWRVGLWNGLLMVCCLELTSLYRRP